VAIVVDVVDVVVVLVVVVLVVVVLVVVVVGAIEATVRSAAGKEASRAWPPDEATAACAPMVPHVAKMVTDTNPNIHIQRRGPRRWMGATGSEPGSVVHRCSKRGTCDFRL
jgi:hypothetical protein